MIKLFLLHTVRSTETDTLLLLLQCLFDYLHDEIYEFRISLTERLEENFRS